MPAFGVHEGLGAEDAVEVVHERVDVDVEVERDDEAGELRVLVQFDLDCFDLGLHHELRFAPTLVVVPDDQLLQRVERVPASPGHRDDVAGVQDLHDADAAAHFC